MKATNLIMSFFSLIYKATKKNVLKDFLAVAGPMGVTHFIIISRTSEYVYLKFARIPRGPTITFRVSKVSNMFKC